MYSTACTADLISSASLSGISTENSSSIAITTSTVSSESRPRSFEKWAFSDTLAGSTLSKPLRMSRTLDSMSLRDRLVEAE
ncbi:hypothetical protein BC938DRAFT_472261 [Jimgerdemannia flammicorona]|uniref:Uncharacterized protein n=1 Tax=Jimgerdemannia flammicorona TaxID=994334 RepID=A0A433QU11_9FUNG|nr:hypothetical protein BC938DRAFT_472261 [Jimgerdemannia flammicorona]